MTAQIASASQRQQHFQLSVPSQKNLLGELRSIKEVASLIPCAPWMLTQPRGDGRRVMVIPGFGANDTVTWPLRQFLKYLGYTPLPWGLGVNQGEPEQDAERLIDRVLKLERQEDPISVIGWSLGGVIARLIAMDERTNVKDVITMGTPVEGGPKYTRAGAWYAGVRGINLDEFEQHVHDINQLGLKTPITVIYSESDSIVGWQASIDRYNPQARHVRVDASHFGMTVNPVIWSIVAKSLAQ